MKQCSQCGINKQESEFHSNGKKGIRSACIECRNHSKRVRYHTGDVSRTAKTAEGIIRDHRREAELKALKEENAALTRELEKANKRQRIIGKLEEFSVPAIKPRERKSSIREATAVILASDWHVEEPVDPDKVNGLNHYNMQIADQRIARMGDAAMWLIDMHSQKFKIRDAVLWLGGDLMSGYIHEELVEANSMSPVKTILWLQERLYALINKILSNNTLEKVTVVCNYGNHGRTTPKRRIQTASENSYEWLLYKVLEDKYANDPRVSFVIPSGLMAYLDVYDFTLRFVHGDQINYWGGVGGVTIPLNKAIKSWNIGRKADITCLGHFHQYMSLQHAVLNGSIIGYSPFSLSIKAEFELPHQSFFLIDSKHGKCCSSPIWVSKVD